MWGVQIYEEQYWMCNNCINIIKMHYYVAGQFGILCGTCGESACCNWFCLVKCLIFLRCWLFLLTQYLLFCLCRQTSSYFTEIQNKRNDKGRSHVSLFQTAWNIKDIKWCLFCRLTVDWNEYCSQLTGNFPIELWSHFVIAVFSCDDGMMHLWYF